MPRTRPSYAQATRSLLRNTLLTAADDLARERDWSEVTMADVAAASGVSRQTLYNEFGSRQKFAQAYVLRKAEEFVRAVGQAVAGHRDDPRSALAAAFDVFLTATADDPLIKAIVSGDGSNELLALVTTHGEPVLKRATERFATVLRDSWPSLPVEEAELVAECVVRLAISYAALPTGPADLTAASVARLLGPHLDLVLARAKS